MSDQVMANISQSYTQALAKSMSDTKLNIAAKILGVSSTTNWEHYIFCEKRGGSWVVVEAVVIPGKEPQGFEHDGLSQLLLQLETLTDMKKAIDVPNTHTIMEIGANRYYVHKRLLEVA